MVTQVYQTFDGTVFKDLESAEKYESENRNEVTLNFIKGIPPKIEGWYILISIKDNKTVIITDYWNGCWRNYCGHMHIQSIIAYFPIGNGGNHLELT